MEEQFYITPTEAVEMQHNLYLLTYQHACRIAEEFKMQSPWSRWGASLLYATLFQAGQVDGIRRERREGKRQMSANCAFDQNRSKMNSFPYLRRKHWRST